LNELADLVLELLLESANQVNLLQQTTGELELPEARFGKMNRLEISEGVWKHPVIEVAISASILLDNIE
jgi:hypothetical protein